MYKPLTAVMITLLLALCANAQNACGVDSAFTIGKDTTLCFGDSLTLRSPEKDNHHHWQDGSTNDSFVVKTSGYYFLHFTDTCGNTRSEIIHVVFRNALTLNLGAARFKCANDSLTITPPRGYEQYDWSPDYRMQRGEDESVIFFPSVDTTYQLIVHDDAGCTGQTQIRINNYRTAAINLGNDTTICTDGAAGFSAGTGFASYAWSTGSNANFIVVHEAGNYSVAVTDRNNCRIRDTVTVREFPQPKVQINGSTLLCRNQVQMLDAGDGFADYLWQNGMHSEWFNILDTGFYKVIVTDQHLCTATDSIHITGYLESPKNFLPPDTAVCANNGILLQPNNDYLQYNWSNGETTRSIVVKLAGDYTCTVLDWQGCPGTDTIHIATKSCESVLVFPNAFTPNQDGLNDIFRLKYPGSISGFHLQIFNRLNQQLFETSDLSAGWDGNYNGRPQPPGAYIWVLHYTDNSGKLQRMQGSVVLVR
jgi:gliding motility-associated-like protein